MTEQEIREIVSKTIDDLLDRDRIKEDCDLNYQYMSKKLKYHYTKRPIGKIQAALDQIKNDPYFRILPDYYKYDHTLLWIAVDIGCDRVTVARNKKRLVLEVYKICYG